MALVKCPECGESISSTAKKCIHCGSTFLLCPECGSFVREYENCCRKCGMERIAIESIAEAKRVQAIKKMEEKPEPQREDAANIERAIHVVMENRKKRDGMFRLLGTVVVVIQFIILLAMGLSALGKSMEANRTWNLDAWFNALKMGRAMIVICFLLASVNAAIWVYYNLSADKKEALDLLKVGKEKYCWYIKAHLKTPKNNKELLAFRDLMRVAYLLENPNEERSITPQRIFNCIGEGMKEFLIASVSIAMFLCAREMTFEGKDLILSMLKTGIVPIILALVMVILSSVFYGKSRKKIEYWWTEFSKQN